MVHKHVQLLTSSLWLSSFSPSLSDQNCAGFSGDGLNLQAPVAVEF